MRPTRTALCGQQFFCEIRCAVSFAKLNKPVSKKMDDPIQSAKQGVALIGEIIKAAGDNPDVKEAGGNLGQTALTITKTINNVMLPLAAVNFAFDKARTYFAERFPQELSAKASSIPAEQLVEPKASIAGPALQGLAFTHEEPNLKEMYLSLLATAMDGRVKTKAHPAFVEIIKQLDSEEAGLLQELLRHEIFFAIVEIRITKNGEQGWNVLEKHIMNLTSPKTGEPWENPRQGAMVDNWVRLGLVEVCYSTKQLHVAKGDAYAWVDKRPEYLRHKAREQGEPINISFERGVIGRTALGIQFGQAVGLL